MRSIIIDDEVNNCLNLKNILNTYCPEVEVLDMGHSALEGLKLIETHQPELIFLDVEMPGGTGFDLLERLPDKDLKVIFVTAYNEYAIKALRLSAIDYLLKPINILDLKAAVARATHQKTDEEKAALHHYLANKSRENGDRMIALPTAERIVYVRIREIIRFRGESNYTYVYLLDGTHVLVSRTLKEYEDLLADSSFIRTHQSHMVNQNHVKSYEKQEGGYLKMVDDSLVGVSRQRKDHVLKTLAM